MLRQMSQPEAWTKIQETLIECAVELFETAALSTAPVERVVNEVALEGTSIVAMIGYAGEGIKGGLLLQATREAAAELQPSDLREAGTPSDAVLRDQMGELANQLLGRLKNRLLGMGVLLIVATPMTAMGNELRVGVSGPSTAAWHVITLPGGRLLVRFDAVITPEFHEAAIAEPPSMSEGEMLLF